MIIDGKKIAEEIKISLKKEIAGLKKKLRLAVVYVGENPASSKFIERKQKFGEEIGIGVQVYKFLENITTESLRKRIAEIVRLRQNIGVIIQLPLPVQINAQYILNSAPPEKDPDMLSAKSIGDFAVGQSQILPPVVGAIKLIFDKYRIDYKNKYIVILGAGNLVGKPAALWLLNEKATFSVVRSATKSPEEFTRKADIIISGVGKPKFITGEMVKEGVIVIDCGTSTEKPLETPFPSKLGNGVSKLILCGDVDFDSVNKKTSYITPVPGGVGPITVATLFKNLAELAKMK